MEETIIYMVRFAASECRSSGWASRFYTASPTPQAKGPTDDFDVEIVQIPAGEFTMGSENSGDDEQPVHTVYLDAFSIDKFEVANALYKTCVDEGVCDPPKQLGSFTRSNYYRSPDFDDNPVIYANWYMAETYCEWRGATLPKVGQTVMDMWTLP